ncbi:IS3 family transposase, partial [Neobacillus rhizosphaerae]|uniref:IS3 family transposase n=1 Tax=Neobacillus rhizosphaerae TaxID=2880965 RepID=UPI00200F1941
MAKKGQQFQRYTNEFKLNAVMKYVTGSKSYKVLADELGILNCTQLKVWVKKWKKGEKFDERSGVSNPLKGRPRTNFKSVEEERDYLKAQVDYLKKQLSKSSKGGDIPQQIKYEIIEGLRNVYPITWLLEIAYIKRASYYKWRSTQFKRDERTKQDQDICEHMMGIHLLHPEVGCPRMTYLLKENDYKINHKKVYRLMKEMNIQSVIRKKRKRHGHTPSVIHPNRLKRKFKATGPNQKMVTDITYVSDGKQFYYLSVIQDLFNNEIVSWELSKRNDLELVLNTVEIWTKKKDVAEAVLHSDQGFQYTSKGYNNRLEAYSIKGSHSRKGNCLDNACIESFFSHLKTEKLYIEQCKSEVEIRQAIEDYIYHYNYKRIQKKLKQRAPIEYRHA